MKKKRLRHISLLLFCTFVINLCLPCLSVRGETISLPESLAEEHFLTEPDSFSDIAGHWAEKEIKAWIARELAGGYPDGSFRPDSPITRAEFVTLVNRAFGYTNMADNIVETARGEGTSLGTYRDVAATDWYAGEIASAVAVGYLGGYPDGTVKPQNQITRQEAAAIFARILPTNNDVLTYDNDSNDNVDYIDNTLAQLTDQAQIPEWSEAAIVAAVKGGYMNGYPDGSFQPTKAITRAEAVAVLERAVGQLYNRAGTYGPFQGTALLEGNVTVNTPGVTLQNTTITGNLYLTEGIGAGDVTLNGVTVQGITKIAGGGSDSIHLRNTSVGAVLVNVPSRRLVRLLAQGSTDVGTLEARTPAILEEEGLSAAGFTKVVIKAQEGSSQGTKAAITIELAGEFSDVEIQEATVQLDLQSGSIANLSLSSSAQGAQINLAAQTTVQTLLADTAVTVQGQGTVETTQANVDGVVIEALAKKVFLADGVQANVAGKTITEDYKYVEPKKKKSRDAALSDLMIDGITVAGFAPDTLSYDVVLPYGTTEEEIPTVTAEAHHAKARITVTQATGLTAPNNTATVVVTAENGRTQTYIVRFTVAESSAKAITAFRFEEFDPDAVGVINEGTNPKTIVVTVPHGTDIISLTPTITHTGESISPESGIPQDFTTPVTYTVTAEDGSTAEYEVTVNVALSTEVSLSKFNIGGENVLALGGINTPEGATLIVADFAGFEGIEVEATDHNATVTVTLNDDELDGDLATQPLTANDVLVVTVMAADGETEGLYKVTVVQGYTVTYDDNGSTGGSVPTDESVYPEGASVTVLANTGALVKDGYCFAGWNTADDGSGMFYEAGATFTMGAANVTLYAQWTIADFAVDENNVFGTTATLTWPTALGATSIALEQSADGGSTWENATTFEDLSPDATAAIVTGLTKNTTYQFRLVIDGGITAGESNTIAVTTKAAAMYGASWNSGNSSTSMTRLGDATDKTAGANFNGFAPWSEMKLCNVFDDGTITAYIDDGTSNFKRDGTNGQVMVKIPKFYYKHTCDNGVHEFWVADGPAAGFKLHPAFIRAGVEKDYILLGAYKASLGRNQTDTVDALASVSGAFPAVSKNITQFRTLAEARGTETGANWTQVDALTRNAVALLYLVEYADTDSQSSTVGIGKGITELRWSTDDRVTVASTNANEIIVSSGTAVHYSKGQIIGVGASLGDGSVCTNRMITGISESVEGNVTITVDGAVFTTVVDNIIYHVGQKTGGCDGKNGVSGSAATYSDGVTPGVEGKVSINYRGLEDLWGNVWEFVDGINIKNSEKQPYVADNGFVSNEFAEPYQPSGITLPSGNGYVKDFACSAKADWLLMPTTVGGGYNTYIPDYYYQNWTGNSADKVALAGGRWAHGADAGLFYWLVTSTSSGADLAVGARVLLIP